GRETTLKTMTKSHTGNYYGGYAVFANVLKSKGRYGGHVYAHDSRTSCSYVCMCQTRAIHSVVFGGYSAESLAERILDGNCKVLVTADGVFRGTKNLHMNAVIVVEHQKNLLSTKKALSQPNGTPKTIVHGYNIDVSWNPKVDVWWHDEMKKQTMSVNPCGGSTGKPKGCLHTTGGYMVYGALTFKYVFDYFPGDVFFCTGDIGWLTGHTYIVYGSLLNTATCILYEGVPTHPDAGRYWEVVEKYGATHFYTAPTAIRTLMRYDDAYVTNYARIHCRYSLQSLRSGMGNGEPINRDAWFWYQKIVGEGRCPIVDTYWQTETGGHLLTPIPFCTPLKPGCASLPFFGVEPAILDEEGNEIKGPGKGYLVIKRPWPAIMRTVYGDHNRFEQTYFSKFPGYYFTGDGGMRDEDGLYWVTGRVDDMLNVSGHLLSTTDVEASLMGHKKRGRNCSGPSSTPGQRRMPLLFRGA
ncbi:acetyl-coenzyme A synthetase, cytoplasmic, partial [Caerostris extrusa]